MTVIQNEAINGKVTTTPFLIEAEQVQDEDPEVDEVIEDLENGEE